MGGQIDWAAIPLLFHMLGVVDPERTIRHLIAIRAHAKRSTNA